MSQLINVVGCDVDVRGAVFRFPVGTRDLALLQSGVHLPIQRVPGGYFPKAKAAGV